SQLDYTRTRIAEVLGDEDCSVPNERSPYWRIGLDVTTVCPEHEQKKRSPAGHTRVVLHWVAGRASCWSVLARGVRSAPAACDHVSSRAIAKLSLPKRSRAARLRAAGSKRAPGCQLSAE